MVCCTYFMNPRPLTVRSRLQGSQPVENLLNACGVQRRSVRYRGCWTPPPAACQTPRRPSPKAPSMGADLDRTACARTMPGISNRSAVFRVCGSPQPLLRQIAWAGLSGRVTAEALPRCFGGVARGGSAPFDPPDARAPAEFAGGGLAPRPSCRCVLSRAPHEGHMAAGSCWGRLRGRGLGEATRGLVGQINGELAEDTRAKSALRTALQAHRGKLGNVDPKALAA